MFFFLFSKYIFGFFHDIRRKYPCFISGGLLLDPMACVYIPGLFLNTHTPPLPSLDMPVSSPTPICGIVHSIWLSLTHTASCLRVSHEPLLPPRKETFIAHRPVSHDYTLWTQKRSFVWNISGTLDIFALSRPFNHDVMWMHSQFSTNLQSLY